MINKGGCYLIVVKIVGLDEILFRGEKKADTQNLSIGFSIFSFRRIYLIKKLLIRGAF